jgi:hypothetical protein
MLTTGGYTAGQLLRYHAYCRANPAGAVLHPGGRAGWDDMTVAVWLRWFWSCLETKINHTAPLSVGKGRKAKRRVERLADARAECGWCGTKTGSSRKRFCCADCQRSCAS